MSVNGKLSGKKFPVNLGLDRYVRLKSYCDFYGASMGEIIRRAIDGYIPEQKEEAEK